MRSSDRDEVSPAGWSFTAEERIAHHKQVLSGLLHLDLRPPKRILRVPLRRKKTGPRRRK